MTSSTTRAGVALTLGLGFAFLATSQTPSRTPTPAVSSTPTGPSKVLTPGTGGLTLGYQTSPEPGMGSVISSMTPGYASNLYSIPETTPVGMPPSATSLTTGQSVPRERFVTATPKLPAAAADCAGDGWLSYSDLGFTSQQGCENWVRRNLAGDYRGSPAPRKGGSKPPNRRATPRPTAAMEAATPGSSITPRLAPTPVPR